MNIKIKMLVIILFTMICEVGNAAVVWDESINGDLNIFDFGNNTIALNESTNTIIFNILTEVTNDPSTAIASDDDRFLITIPVGLEISEVSMTLNNITITEDAPQTVRNVGASLFTTGFSRIGNSDFTRAEINNAVFPLLIFEANNLSISEGIIQPGNGFSWVGDSDFTISADYSLNLKVSSVPIPGAVWLFGTGLIGVIGMRKKLQVIAISA